MNESNEKLLEKHGWTVICESPFELENEDGDVATGEAADMILSLFNLFEENRIKRENVIENIDEYEKEEYPLTPKRML